MRRLHVSTAPFHYNSFSPWAPQPQETGLGGTQGHGIKARPQLSLPQPRPGRISIGSPGRRAGREVSEEGDGFTGEPMCSLLTPLEMRHMSNCSLNLSLIKQLSEKRPALELTATGRRSNNARIGRLICHGFALQKEDDAKGDGRCLVRFNVIDFTSACMSVFNSKCLCFLRHFFIQT